MIEAIIAKVIQWLLTMLFNAASKEIKRQRDQMERDKLNAENIKKYKEAKNRAEKIKSALDLINGN